MTEADVDSDGDEDLLLGSFTSMDIPRDTAGITIKKRFDAHNTLLLLKNTTVRQ